MAAILTVLISGEIDWGSGLFAATILSIITGFVLYFITAVVRGTGSKVVDFSVKKDNERLNELRGDLIKENQKLKKMDSELIRIRDNKTELRNVEDELNNNNNQIKDIKLEGIRKYR